MFFCHFPYYGKIRKSEYCMAEKLASGKTCRQKNSSAHFYFPNTVWRKKWRARPSVCCTLPESYFSIFPLYCIRFLFSKYCSVEKWKRSYFSAGQYSDFIFLILQHGKMENGHLVNGQSYFSAVQYLGFIFLILQHGKMENRHLLSGRSYFSAVQYSDFIFLILQHGKMENCHLLSGQSYFSAVQYLGFLIFPQYGKWQKNMVDFYPTLFSIPFQSNGKCQQLRNVLANKKKNSKKVLWFGLKVF